MTTTAIAKPQEHDKLSVWLAQETVRNTISNALAGYVDPDKFLSHILIHIQSKPELAECSVSSQYTAIHTCAMLGLLPGFTQVALIPRAKQLTVMPQWQGLKSLMERHPDVDEVCKPMLVHVRDKIAWAGEGDDIRPSGHAFDPLDPERKIESIKDILGGYVKIRMRDGTNRYHVIRADYIQKCMNCAQTKNVWSAWFEQQAMKTVLRSAYSRRIIPIDPLVQGRVEAFLSHEDQLLGNDPRMTVESEPIVPAASRAAALAQRLNQQAASEAPLTQASNLPVVEPDTQGSAVVGAEADVSPRDSADQPADGRPSLATQFEAMWSETSKKTEANLDRLYRHFISPGEGNGDPLASNPTDVAAIKRIYDEESKKLSASPKQRQQQKPLMD